MNSSRSFLFILVQIIFSLLLATSIVSCSAFSTDENEESILENEIDTEDELAGELDDVDEDVELADSGNDDEFDDDDDDLDDLEADDDDLDEDEDEDIEEEESDDLDEELADNDLDDDDDDELADDDLDDGDDDISDEDFEKEFADIDDDDDDDVDEVDEDEEFSDEDVQSDEEALAKELGGKQDYPETAGAEPAFPEEVVEKEGAVPSEEAPPIQSGLVTSETVANNMEEPPAPSIPSDDLGMADPIVPADEKVNNNGLVPVVKIKSDPFYRNDRLLNTVYIARPGDTIKSISGKIYEENRVQIILDDNGHLEKGVDPGDKIYYTSPNRPEDKTSLKVFYADQGLQAQTYTSKKGDNMRRLGSKLLGFSEGWKEIWAINPNVDSKTILKTGTELRYWTGDEQTVEQMMAKTEEVPPEDPVDDPGPPPTQPSPPVVSELPPEPALPDVPTQAGLPGDPAMAGGMLPEPLEPLPEADITQVPEEMPDAIEATDDSLLTMGVIGLLVLAGVALVAIQIKNRKAQTSVSPPSLEYTQV